jgi:hypothetical protein
MKISFFEKKDHENVIFLKYSQLWREFATQKITKNSLTVIIHVPLITTIQ